MDLSPSNVKPVFIRIVVKSKHWFKVNDLLLCFLKESLAKISTCFKPLQSQNLIKQNLCFSTRWIIWYVTNSTAVNGVFSCYFPWLIRRTPEVIMSLTNNGNKKSDRCKMDRILWPDWWPPPSEGFNRWVVIFCPYWLHPCMFYFSKIQFW